MSETLGVWGEPLGAGVLFRGPLGRRAWAPDGELSSALGFVVGWDVAAHPWDPWSFPSSETPRLPPPPRVSTSTAAKPSPQRRRTYAR